MIYDEMFQNGLKTPYEFLLTCSHIFKDFVKKSGKCSFTFMHLSRYFCHGHLGNKDRYTFVRICIQFHSIFDAANAVTLEKNLSLILINAQKFSEYINDHQTLRRNPLKSSAF